MDIRDKYKIDQWVLSSDGLEEGDRIAFECPVAKRELIGRFLRPANQRGTLVLDVDNRERYISYYDNILYRVDKWEDIAQKGCTCGAKHTSNKNYHLRYCDIK